MVVHDKMKARFKRITKEKCKNGKIKYRRGSYKKQRGVI